MNEKDRLKIAFESIAHREVPETANLWPQIAAKLERKDTVMMNPKLKLAWTLILVLLGLALATGAVYALYAYLKGDPGLEAVSEAGLVTNLELTTAPELLPTQTPRLPASAIGTEQTLQGVTLTLDWIYLDDAWQSFGFTVANLANGQRLGQPAMYFGAITPEWSNGASMSLNETETGLQGLYFINQIVRNENYPDADTFVDIDIEIPLLDASGQQLATFRFSNPQMQVHRAQYYEGGNTTSTSANNLEMRLDWIVFTPQDTRARLCYDQPNLKLEKATLQWGQDAMDLYNVPVSPSQQVLETDSECWEVIFPADTQNSKAFRLVVDTLKDENNTDYPGAWEFTWLFLPQHTKIPGITPIEAQTFQESSITMIQAYADAARIAAVLKIEGAQIDLMSTNVVLKDQQGRDFNAGVSITVDPEDPSLYTYSFTPMDMSQSEDDSFSKEKPLSGERFQGQIVITFNAYGKTNQAPQSFTFDLDLPVYPAKEIQVGQTRSANGLEMRLEQLIVTPSYTYAYLCFQKPDTGDWYLSWQGTNLLIGNAQFSSESADLLFDSDLPRDSYLINSPDPDWTPPITQGRCLRAGFPLGHHNKPETLTLTVRGLELTTAELLSDEKIELARQKLREQGIEMDWITYTGGGGGGSTYQVTQKPDGMTDEEVLERFYTLLGYYVNGPWVFTIEMQP